MKPILRPGESAEAGQQHHKGILWDAVFRRSAEGTTTLIALVDGADVAEFFARALNQEKV